MIIRGKKLRAVVIIMAVILVPLFCANGVLAQTKEPVKIGLILPMTGPAALYGEQCNRGAELAVDWINKAGGILGGRPVKIYLEDDQANPVEGVNAVKKLMTREGIKMITGGVNSSVSLAEVEVTKENKLLQFVTCSTAPAIREQGHPWLFALQPTNTMKDDFFLPWVTNGLKAKTAALLTENTDYGRAELDGIKKYWGGKLPKVISSEIFQLGETDFTVLFNKFKALKPDIIYITTAAPTTNGAILKQIAEVGYTGKVLLAPGNLNMDVVRLAGKGGEGALCSDYYINTLDTELNNQFIKAYLKRYNRMPEKMEMLGYQSISILADAIDKAGSEYDVQKVTDTIRNNKWPTPRGYVTFDEKGQCWGEGQSIVTGIRDSKIVIVDYTN